MKGLPVMKTFTTVAILIAMTPLACAARQPRAQDAPPAPQQQAAQDEQRRQAQSDQRGQAPQTAGEDRPRNRAPRDEAAQTQGPPSNTWLARRQVRVSMGENPDAARAAVQSVTGVETIRDVASARGIPADAQVVNVRVEEDGERDAVHVWISVDLSKAPQAPRVAREVADDLVNRLRESLAREAQGGMAQQLERFRAEHDRAEAELAAPRQQLTALRAKVREATGRSTASVERVRDELAQLEDRRQELQLELESKAARMEALS